MEQAIPEQQPNPEELQKPRSHIKIIIALVIALIIVSIPVALTLVRSTSAPAAIKNRVASALPDTSPTPFPVFRELTVPYLREREYASDLRELELIAENGSYTSYVTSYDSDGFRVNGLLTRPAGETPEGGWPAVVFIHGYIPPTLYETTTQYADYVDFIARSGFVVYKIDLRGHGNSEGEAGGGYYGSDYVIDTLNARAALQSSEFVNPEKIGLWGHSMAGNIVMRSMAARPEIPAGVVWAGAVYTYEDQRKYGINDSSFSPNQFSQQRQSSRRQLFEKYGSPSAKSVFWREVAPTNYLEDLEGAVALHHAADDTVVNIGYSRDLVGFLKQAGVPYEFYEYPLGGHNISGSSFVTAMQRTVEFYKKHLNASD